MDQNTNKKLWFKAKRYGWGWYPVSWEGWVVMLVYIVIILKIATKIDENSHSGSDTLISFAIPFIGLTCLLLLICYKKGEWPTWNWGPEKKDEKKD